VEGAERRREKTCRCPNLEEFSTTIGAYRRRASVSLSNIGSWSLDEVGSSFGMHSLGKVVLI
jgi:hypothetical protein